MLTIEEILNKLKDRNLSKVADLAGISQATLYKITSGRSIEVSYSVVKKLSDYLENNP